MMRVLPIAEHHSEEAGAVNASPPDTTPGVSPFYRFAAFVSRPVVKWLYRLEVRGLEHVPKAGGLVVAANHTSNLDPWPLAVALEPRQLHFMAKSELWKPGLRTLLRWGGAFPVRRGEGRVMAMFPEGTRRSKGLRKKHQPRPHTGTARIALAAGVPILPAAISGMDRLSRLGPLRVAFGPVVPVDDLAELDARSTAQETTRRLWAEMQRLEAELVADSSRAG